MHSSADGGSRLAVTNDATVNDVHVFLGRYVFSFLSSAYLGMELLHHMAYHQCSPEKENQENTWVDTRVTKCFCLSTRMMIVNGTDRGMRWGRVHLAFLLREITRRILMKVRNQTGIPTLSIIYY